MYRFIYFFMVKVAEKRNPDPLFMAAGFTAFVQFTHISLVFAIIKKTFNIEYPHFSDDYVYNKLCAMPFAILWIVIVHFYYKRLYPALLERYSDGKILTIKNTIIVLSILLIPLITMIMLLKK